MAQCVLGPSDLWQSADDTGNLTMTVQGFEDAYYDPELEMREAFPGLPIRPLNRYSAVEARFLSDYPETSKNRSPESTVVEQQPNSAGPARGQLKK